MKKLRKSKLLLLLVGLIIISFLGRMWLAPRNVGKAESVTVKRGEVKEELTLSGKIDAEEHVTLQFQIGGLLSWVGVKEGDTVIPYQALAALDSRQLRKTLDKYLNLYLKTRWDFEQTQDDNEGKIITDKIKRILEKSQFDLNNSVLDVELQNLAVELATLTTPIAGVVTRIDTPYAGVNITPVQAQFEVVNPQTLYFQVTADQTEVVKIKPGAKAQITFDAFPQEKVEGEVSRIGFTPKAGETSTVYEVRLALRGDGSRREYRLGMTGDATFTIVEVPNALFIPPSFVKSDDKGRFVWRGAKKQKTYVELGLEGENRLEVKSGVKEGDVLYD